MSKKEKELTIQEDGQYYENLGFNLAGILLAFRPTDSINVYQVNIRNNHYECLVMLKAIDADGDKVIAFIGGRSVGSALGKAVQGYREDPSIWRPDRFAGDNA